MNADSEPVLPRRIVGIVLPIAGLVAGVATLIARRLETAPIPEPILPTAGLSPGARLSACQDATFR